MQFETRIVNGKPSIFYKEDPIRSEKAKKINTKDKLVKKEIRKSYEVNGEVDMVKPSPRAEQQKTVVKNDKREIKLTQEQLLALINAIKTSNIGGTSDNDAGGGGGNAFKSNSLENLNLNLNLSGDEATATNTSKNINVPSNNKIETLAESNNMNARASSSDETAKKLLLEKKKQKWIGDKDLLEKLNFQEQYDKQKFLSAQQPKNNVDEDLFKNNNSQRGGQSSTNDLYQVFSAHKSTMTLAEKKRIQWQLEKGVDDDLLVYTLNDDKNNILNAVKLPSLRKNNREDLSKFFNSSTGDLSKLIRPSEIGVENDSLVRKASSLNNLSELEKHDINHNQANRNSLMEKKKQQWLQDRESAEDWMFGKSASKERSTPRQTLEQEDAKTMMDNGVVNQKQAKNIKKPPPVPKDYKDALEEYSKIKSAIEAITKAENKIKREQYQEEKANNSLNNSSALHSTIDQSRVPAAMRTSIMFGNVRFDEDIQRMKELERKQWLKDLEEQKKQKLLESQQQLQREEQQQQQESFTYNHKSNVGSLVPQLSTQHVEELKPNSPFSEEKSFGRTRILLDPAQIEDLERKRRANMAHKREIDAQIEEKRRRKQLEDELAELDKRKADNEAREQLAHRDQSNEAKRAQPHYRNLEKIFNEPSTGGDERARASVLQGEGSRHERETQTVRSNATDTRANEVYKAMRAAELAAAEEKHRRLLKRLQRGGHDTRQLERKFAELKARLTGQSLGYEGEPPTSSMITSNDRQAISGPYYEKDPNEEKKRQQQEQQQATLNRIFQMVRENTKNALPAELNEHDLKQLIINQNSQLDSKPPPPPHAPPSYTKKELIDRQKQQQQEQKQVNQQSTKRALNGEKPIWNYQNMEGRRALPNSKKDPFYAERAKFIEERRQKRLEYFRSRSNKARDYSTSQQSHRSVDTVATTATTATTRGGGVSHSNANENSINQQKESLMKLLTKNLAANPIYEEDEDLFINNNNNNTNAVDHERNATNLNKSNSSSIEDMLASNRGYVPFLRTNEILDPVHAASPVPPSREPSAIKKSREKARQAYFQNMKPADYGSYYQPTYEETKYRNKDPLLNNNLVRNNPTPRQEQILSQLASLKQSLIKKQKEIASSISQDQYNYDDYDKQND